MARKTRKRTISRRRKEDGGQSVYADNLALLGDRGKGEVISRRRRVHIAKAQRRNRSGEGRDIVFSPEVGITLEEVLNFPELAPAWITQIVEAVEAKYKVILEQFLASMTSERSKVHFKSKAQRNAAKAFEREIRKRAKREGWPEDKIDAFLNS